jgi:hypothetical protein
MRREHAAVIAVSAGNTKGNTRARRAIAGVRPARRREPSRDRGCASSPTASGCYYGSTASRRQRVR